MPKMKDGRLGVQTLLLSTRNQCRYKHQTGLVWRPDNIESMKLTFSCSLLYLDRTSIVADTTLLLEGNKMLRRLTLQSIDSRVSYPQGVHSIHPVCETHNHYEDRVLSVNWSLDTNLAVTFV